MGTPPLGYDGKLPFKWSDTRLKKDWPTALPEGPPAVNEKFIEANADVAGQKVPIPIHRQDAESVPGSTVVWHSH